MVCVKISENLNRTQYLVSVRLTMIDLSVTIRSFAFPFLGLRFFRSVSRVQKSVITRAISYAPDHMEPEGSHFRKHFINLDTIAVTAPT